VTFRGGGGAFGLGFRLGPSLVGAHGGWVMSLGPCARGPLSTLSFGALRETTLSWFMANTVVLRVVWMIEGGSGL
jgi:hypothetical protein